MNILLQALKPWEYTTKNLYILCQNVYLEQPFNQILFRKKILNCNLKVFNTVPYNVNTDDSIYVIPIIKDHCQSQIYLKRQLFLNNCNHKGIFIILQDNWNMPYQASIEFSDMIYDFTSIMFNNFFTLFFNHICNTRINIYCNIPDKYWEQLINLISQLKIFYKKQLVHINYHYFLPERLQFQEHDFLINRLQNFANTFKPQNYCVAKRINAQMLNANDTNITYFEIIEDISYTNWDNDRIRQLIELFKYFIDIPIYLA